MASEETVESVPEEIVAEPTGVDQWNNILGFLFSPTVGWSIIAVVIILILLWNRIQNFLDKIYENRQQREYDAKCHKDPDWVMGHFERMEAARRKMQEQYNVQAAVHQEKVAEREKIKRLEKLSKCTLEGNRLGDGSNSSQSEYNPLDGNSGGRYRPPKRSTCPGGGCG